MWSRIDPTIGLEYETELRTKNKFLKGALDGGARLARHTDTEASAHDIIRKLLENTPRPLRLQQELVDEQKKIFQTAAGEALLQDLALLQQKYHQEYLDLEQELAEARQREDEIAQAEIQEEREKMEESKKRLEAEKAKLMQLQLTYTRTVAQIQALTRVQTQTGQHQDDGDGDEPVKPKGVLGEYAFMPVRFRFEMKPTVSIFLRFLGWLRSLFSCF